jgi:hypothetical protein
MLGERSVARGPGSSGWSPAAARSSMTGAGFCAKAGMQRRETKDKIKTAGRNFFMNLLAVNCLNLVYRVIRTENAFRFARHARLT